MTFYNTGVDQILENRINYNFFFENFFFEKFYLVDSGSRNFFPDIISFVIITSQLNIDIESTVDYCNMGCEVSKEGQNGKI